MKTEGRGKALIIGLFVVAAIILGKLFYIQIIDDEYKINSNNNSMVYDIIYPTRGIIYDRNGKPLFRANPARVLVRAKTSNAQPCAVHGTSPLQAPWTTWLRHRA